MSRSKRKTKIFGIAGSSEKQDKRRINRVFRRLTRSKLNAEIDPDLPVDLDEIETAWTMSKDGKRYWRNAPEWAMRK